LTGFDIGRGPEKALRDSEYILTRREEQTGGTRRRWEGLKLWWSIWTRRGWILRVEGRLGTCVVLRDPRGEKGGWVE